MSALLELRRVGRTFHHRGGAVTACREVDLEVGEGEVVGLVGESGSGKSTLANLALGLLRPDQGEVRFAGRPLADWLAREPRALRAQVQAVFQHPQLAMDGRKRVGWSVAEPLVIHRVGNRATRQAMVAELLERVGLDPAVAQRKPRELSGGQLQRANIARALALGPRLLVCDEPVSALDVSVQAQVLNLFLDIQRDQGTAMLFIGHDLAVVRHVSDRLVVMYAGRVVEQGPTEAVCAEPHHPYTQALLGAALEPEAGGERPPAPLRRREGLPEAGCRFAPRCPLAEAACRAAEPPLRSLMPGRQTACRRAEELVQAPA